MTGIIVPDPPQMLGAGTGGGKPADILAIMQDELSKLAFEGEVRIVAFRPRHSP